MKRVKYLAVLVMALAVILANIAAWTHFRTLEAQNKQESQYQVLSPWAEVDPIPLKGLAAPEWTTWRARR